MPKENNFLHSKYSRSDPGERVAYREFQPGPPVTSPTWQEAMAQAVSTLAAAGVRAILFVSGSPLGTDLFGTSRLDEVGGLKRGYSRGIPGLESLLAAMRPATNGLPQPSDDLAPPFHDDEDLKRKLDALVGDKGNYSAEYIRLFQEAVNQSTSHPLKCSRYLWSSEHHHLGRVEAALALLEHLRTLAQDLSLDSAHRVLIHAHGHAGQVLAFFSNLIGSPEPGSRNMFFEVLRSHYEQEQGSSECLERLEGIEHLLTTETFLNGCSLDVVTLGTAIRYGWETSRIGRLLHIVNHRPARSDGKRWLAKMELPQITWEMPMAVGGDYVQQLAVAGTDAVPTSLTDQEVNKTLQELLEPYDGFERWLECARRVTRCANDGQCLLIDYQDTESDNPGDHLFGHACYTRMQMMLFNTQEITKSLYASESEIQ